MRWYHEIGTATFRTVAAAGTTKPRCSRIEAPANVRLSRYVLDRG